MPPLPTGTVTFLFTDIEGSTRLWEQQASRMQRSLARHDFILKGSIEGSLGHVFKTVGDAFCAAFATALDALKAALDAQAALAAEAWEVEGGIRVRMALHTGTAEERDGDYFGPTLNRVARLLGIGYGGQVLVSLVTEELLRDILPDDTTLRDVGEHRLKDLMRPEKVYQVGRPGLRAEFPALKSLDNHPNNLPLQPTPFLGRERELAAVQEMLQGDAVRILTLTGPGGTGKTRLALQSAANLSERFDDGIYFVDLSPIDTPSYIIPAITRTLEMKESGGRQPVDLLREFTHHRRMLLVLDNFEQISGGDPYVVQLLAACPSLKLIVTSREALHLRGEQVFPVPPLSAPKVQQARAMQLAHLHQYEAVSLFIERARSLKPEFSATNENAPAIAEICARLDGLPLAIELAAARVSLLTPQAILERLGQRLKLLTGGLADLPHRQRTLRATIDWSYRLLGPLEQTLLREASVFAGSATLDAMEKVCACAEQADILDTLGSLVAKSLLVQEDRSGEPRFAMMESIREYGRELLEKAGAANGIREAHARYFLGLAEATREKLRGATSEEALGRFDVECDNFQAALDWLNKAGRVDDELRLCVALGRYWSRRGHVSIGMHCLERSLGAAGDRLCRPLARALWELGNIVDGKGDSHRAIELMEKALPMLSALHDEQGVVGCRLDLGEALRFLGNLEGARKQFTAALEDGSHLDATFAARALNGLGLLEWREGSLAEARHRFEECRGIAADLGDRSLLAKVAGNLGILQFQAGRNAEALACYAETLRILSDIGDVEGTILAYNNLGMLHLQMGSFRQAAESYLQLEGVAQSIGSDRWLSLAHSGMSDAARNLGDTAAALVHAERACTLARHFGPSMELGVATRALGDANLSLARFEEARDQFALCIPMLEEWKDQEDLALARQGHERAMRELDFREGHVPS